jgi:prevent-host-death family protein
MTIKTVPAGEFEAHRLRIVDQVRKRRQPVLITTKGVAVAKLVPVEDTERDVVGCLEGVMEIVRGIEAPVIGPEARELDRRGPSPEFPLLDSSLLKTVW